jgi:D-alanyl-D-alanine dipeptidase
MALPARTQIVKVRRDILSIYKNRSGALAPLSGLRAGSLVPAAADALAALHDACAADGGTLRVSDCFRSIEDQKKARAKYDNWVAAGKPKRSSDSFNSKTMKAAYTSLPGRSFHCTGRSVDVDHMNAAPSDVPRDKKLDWLWERAKPLGWRPVIKTADEGKSEAWHFDFMGEWAPVFDRIGYNETAMCGVLDLGLGADVFSRAEERWIQAQLHRIGQDVGTVDGYLGANTKSGLAAIGLSLSADREALMAALATMASAA